MGGSVIIGKSSTRLRTLTLLVAGLAAGTAAERATEVSAGVAADGRTVAISAPGWSGKQGGYAARIKVNGQEKELTSAQGTLAGPIERATEATPYGQAELSVTTLRFENVPVDLLLRQGRVPGVAGVLLQAGIRNRGQEPLELLDVTPLALPIQVTGKAEEWLITSFHSSMQAPTALDDLDTHTPLAVHEAGGFYRQDGTGFLFGPVGTPTAYVGAHFTAGQDGRVLFQLAADMSGAQVDPGATRWGQQVVLLMEPPNPAVARWAEWVGKTHGARTAKGALSGWNSWNFLKNKDNGKEVLKVTDAVRMSAGRLRPAVIEMDDARTSGKAVLDAPWLPAVAQRVGETGARFGLRLAFDNRNPQFPSPCLPVEVTATVRRAVLSGCSYLKISCPPAVVRAAGEKRTAFEIYRDDWAAIRQAAGEDAYLLFCALPNLPDRAVVGSVDASRTGADAGRLGLRTAMKEVVGSYPLHARWFAVDNDVYYMAAEDEGQREVAGGWPLLRTWLSMVGLSCGAAITPDPWYVDNYKAYWRKVEVLTPPAVERTEVLGLGTRAEWSGLVGHVRRDWADATVVLLWNSGAAEQAVALDFAAAGLDPKRRYAVWSFWDNQFLGIAKGAWTTPMLTRSASQQLRFTDLDRKPNQPQLIGSNLHIYCGAAEIKRVTSTSAAMQIELTDAGAREGDLFVYSRWPPVLKAVTGCAARGVVQAGENVWRIGLVERQHGVPQRVDLDIQLPVTRHAWFWLLVAGLVASLVLAASRYVASRRLQRLRAVDQERARIARDIHDEIGSRLARLSLLGEMAADQAPGSPAAVSWLQEITRGVRAAAGELEHIIWSMNPKHDTLDGLAQRICQHAEEFFADTPVSCRFETLPEIPAQTLRPDARETVMRAVKEALANVLKHAAAATVVIGMDVGPRDFQVRITDDGCGFDPSAPPAAHGGNGLTNLRERLVSIGGECRIESAPGRGTIVRLRWPLDKTRAIGASSAALP